MKLPLKWEFPGGKLENRESLEACLIREIKEELSISICIDSALIPVIYHYDTFSITLYPFICRISNGEIELKEHSKFTWAHESELHIFDLAPADIPILNQLSTIWN